MPLTYIRAMIYNSSMKKYYTDSFSTSYIRYYIAFCPRYRRKIFLIPGLKEQTDTILLDNCSSLGIEILETNYYEDTALLSLQCHPYIKPYELVRRIKACLAGPLVREFQELSKMPNLWTKSFYISTDGFDHEELDRFIYSQRKK